VYWAQQHAALARSTESIRQVIEVVREGDLDLLGPPLSAEVGVGLDVPDTPVVAGEEWPALVTGVAHRLDATCYVLDAHTGRQVDVVPLQRRDGALVAPVRLPRPGLYRIAVYGSGNAPVSQLVLAG
jgi:hypothetical protein